MFGGKLRGCRAIFASAVVGRWRRGIQVLPAMRGLVFGYQL
jgi:hypothetical protein